MRLQAAGDRYLELHAATKRAPKFHEYTVRVLQRHFEERMLSDITPADADAFMAWRRAEVAVATANRSLAVLKHMFKLAIRWGHLRESPAADARQEREATRASGS